MANTYDPIKLNSVSEDIKEKLLSGDKELVKTAAMAAEDYFRTEIRENGILRKRLPVEQVTDDRLAYVEDNDFPVMFVEIAGTSAGARQVGFETGPSNEVIHGLKARVEFSRLMTPKYSIDKYRLKAYKMPILDILYDLMLKDIMDCEDTLGMAVDNTILGTIDANNTEIGCKRYVHAGPLSRNAMVHMKKSMFKTKGHLQPAQYLMNYGTYCDFGGFGRDEVGGDMAQDMFINGVATETIQGIKTTVTTKWELVPDNKVYIYTDPKYYGGFYTMEDVSMVSDTQDNIWLSFFAHEIVGMSVVNCAAVAAVLFEGTQVDWSND